MIELNALNGAGEQCRNIAKKLMYEATGALFGCEMGVAWGGGIEKLGRIWNGRGIIWGFDTFEGHPKHLASVCDATMKAGADSYRAVDCMDHYYKEYVAHDFHQDYIRSELDAQGLHNVCLVKGLIDEKTTIGFIPYLHYCLLDMDFPVSMENGYNLVKDKIVPGGYLCLHDVVPHGHIPGLGDFYEEIKAEGCWEVIQEDSGSLLAILRKK